MVRLEEGMTETAILYEVEMTDISAMYKDGGELLKDFDEKIEGEYLDDTPFQLYSAKTLGSIKVAYLFHVYFPGFDCEQQIKEFEGRWKEDPCCNSIAERERRRQTV